MRKIIIPLLLLMCVTAVAQKERGFARKGNRYYADSAYTEAEVAYLKALDVNPDLHEAQFNLANANLKQAKFDKAIEQYDMIAEMTLDKITKSEVYHNMANTHMQVYQANLQDQEKAEKAGEDLDKAIETYKKALRNNPSDNETRYNLAVAQKLKKEGPPPQDQQQEQDKQDQQDKKDQEKEQDKDQEQQQNEDQQDQEQDQQQQQSQPDKISKEDAEKILNAMMQDEKELQEEQKEKQKAAMKSKRVEKDW